MSRPLADVVHASWVPALTPVADRIEAMGEFLREENSAGRGYLPAGENVLRAFSGDFADVRVLIVGQDPYPTPGHAVGLSFSVDADVRPLPRSLKNIYRELHDDLGVEPCEHGDLTSWFAQGVLLLNRVLTVRPGRSASHRGKGWEPITAAAISALAQRDRPLVAILWGGDARKSRDLLPGVDVLTSAHPSPLSADRGFFGSGPFSAANAALGAQGAEPVDWVVR